MVICLKRDADLHMAQLMPLPLTVSCFIKIQIGFTFLAPAHPGSPGKRAVKRVCVCVCSCLVQHCSRVDVEVDDYNDDDDDDRPTRFYHASDSAIATDCRRSDGDDAYDVFATDADCASRSSDGVVRSASPASVCSYKMLCYTAAVKICQL